jgi:Ala-tRNA(Pro) deacylase
MNFESFLQQRAVPFERHTHAVTYTAQALANAEHVTGYMVAKPVVVRTNAGFAMCAVAAPRHVDLKRVGAVLHDPQVRLASEPELAKLFPDCELGAEPPIGALYGLPTVMDAQLRTDEYLVMQAGTHREAVKLRREDFERVCEPMVAPIVT